MTKEELKDIIKECIMEMTSDNNTDIESVNEGLFKKSVKLPEEMRFTYDDFQKASAFKKKLEDSIKYYEKEGADKKQISKHVYTAYFGNVANAFDKGIKDNRKYEAKLHILVPYIKKYDDKKDAVIKDIVNTQKVLDGAVEKGTALTPLQKAYKADIDKALKMLQ